MAITYEQSSALMRDSIFVGRCKVAVIKFATFILDEASSTPAHNTRERWAMNALADSDAQTQRHIPTIVLDPAVQSAGGAIDDAGLQSAVENAIQKML